MVRVKPSDFHVRESRQLKDPGFEVYKASYDLTLLTVMHFSGNLLLVCSNSPL